jgi:hypothetical protein
VSRLPFEATIDKRRALESAEAAGQVADSTDYRHTLLERVRSGEISLETARAELKKTQKNAKRNGLRTRLGVWRQA